MSPSSCRCQVGNGDVVAVSEAHEWRFNAEEHNQRVAGVFREETTVPNPSHKRTFAYVDPKVELLKFTLAAVQDVGRNPSFNAFHTSLEGEFGACVPRDLHGQTTRPNHQTFVGLVEVVAGHASVELLVKASNPAPKSTFFTVSPRGVS